MNQLSELEHDLLTLEETNEVTFIEEVMTAEEASVLLKTMLKDLSGYYNKQYLRTWIKDQSLSKEVTNHRIQKLSELREQLRNYLEESVNSGEKVQLKASFTLSKSN